MYEIKRDRFHLLDPDLYILQGDFPTEHKVEAFLDHTPIEVTETDWEGVTVLEQFRNRNLVEQRSVTLTLKLPQSLQTYRKLKVYVIVGKRRQCCFGCSVKELIKKQRRPYYFIEESVVDASLGNCRIRGWVAAKDPVTIEVYDEERRPVTCSVSRLMRTDVENLYAETKLEEKPGFYLELTGQKAKKISLVFRTESEYTVYSLGMTASSACFRKTKSYVEKAWQYLRTYGVVSLIRKVIRKLAGRREKPIIYGEWIQKHLPDSAALEAQRRETFVQNPLFSIVVPLYRTPEKYLCEMIESVQAQTYSNWELVLSDGSGADSPVKELVESYQRRDERIRLVSNETQLHISENTNAAIRAAAGDFLVFMDHDDVLAPHALYECVKVINEKKDTEVLYSDEDKMTMDGHKFFQPHFKPDFNLDLLCTVNYICHLFVVRKTVAEQAGFLDPQFDGAQDYDFILRCVERSDRIVHIPKILYHWRCHEDSTAENPESKSYAFDAGAKAVQAHYDRMQIPAVVEKGEYAGLYRTRYQWEEEPLISIIIPNKDHIEDLKRCMDSIDQRSTYRKYEYVIVENNSTEPETFAFYEELKQKRENVQVVYYKGGFNFSAINNYGVQFAKGSYYLLLNNDTAIINPDCLKELLGYCMRKDVGAVGARLYYEDDTIQHAGVVVGFGGIAGHCFVQQPRSTTGYCHRIICAQDYSAVTAACMLVKKSVFEEVQGLTEELAVAFNDIDLCMKIGAAGYRVVYNPYAELYHYESKSRGMEDTPEKKARFNQEIALFHKRWPAIVRDGDPYYNPNLSLETQDFSIKRI